MKMHEPPFELPESSQYGVFVAIGNVAKYMVIGAVIGGLIYYLPPEQQIPIPLALLVLFVVTLFFGHRKQKNRSPESDNA